MIGENELSRSILNDKLTLGPLFTKDYELTDSHFTANGSLSCLKKLSEK